MFLSGLLLWLLLDLALLAGEFAGLGCSVVEGLAFSHFLMVGLRQVPGELPDLLPGGQLCVSCREFEKEVSHLIDRHFSCAQLAELVEELIRSLFRLVQIDKRGQE